MAALLGTVALGSVGMIAQSNWANDVQEDQVTELRMARHPSGTHVPETVEEPAEVDPPAVKEVDKRTKMEKII